MNRTAKVSAWMACALATGFFGLRSGAQSPAFTDIRMATNREAVLQLTAPTGLSYRIDAAAEIENWFSLLTLTSTGVNVYADSGAPFVSARFYRAMQVTNAITGDHLITDDGDVVIHPLNHASFVMRWKDLMIYNDPVGGSTRYAGLPRADLVLIGHEHNDHYDTNTLNAVLNSSGLIIATQTIYNRLTPPKQAVTIILTNGAGTNLLGLRVDAVPAYNTFSNPYHARGIGNGYILTIGGKRLYMAGDTSNTPEMRALQSVDVAFMPMNLPYTMNVDDAVNAVRAYRPKVVYPYHYIPSTPTADIPLFKRLVGTDFGIEVRLRKWY